MARISQLRTALLVTLCVAFVTGCSSGSRTASENSGGPVISDPPPTTGGGDTGGGSTGDGNSGGSSSGGGSSGGGSTGGGSGGSNPPSTQEVQGIAPPSSVAVVTATNTN